nr:extracellular solute-binding protein [Paenibacillus pinihumi]
MILLASSVLAACASNTKGGNTASEGGTGPVEISVFTQQEATQDLKTSDFTKLVEDKFNIRFKWEIIPYDGAKEKRQISLASGDYPDTYILTDYVDQFSQADVLRYSQQGIFVPLNDLIEQYAPNIKAAMDKNPTLKAMNTAPDGNIYGLVNYSECFHCSYPNKMWINTKWLEEMKLEMPKTTDDFRNVLKAFKTGDPNGNKKADEVPLSGSTEDFGVRIVPFLMNGFIYNDDRNYLTMKDGKVDTAANKPEWKEGLAYIKSLYDEGLIDKGAFTQNAEAFKRIGENADAQILGAGAGMHPAIFVNTGEGNTRGMDYNPLPPLQGPHASYTVHNASSAIPGAKFVITNKASEEAKIALIKLVDYLYTPEGQVSAEAGKEGVGWRKPEAGEKALGENVTPLFASIPSKEGDKPNNTGWYGMGNFYMPKEYRDSWVQGEDIYASSGYERRLYQATLQYQGKEPKEIYPVWAVWIDPALADEQSMLQINLKNYIDQYTLQFITGSKDLNKDWDTYTKGLENLKLGRFLEIMQQSYDVTYNSSK